MRRVIRLCFVIGLPFAAVGCASLGYEGPSRLAYTEGHVEQVGTPGVHSGLACHPRPRRSLPVPSLKWPSIENVDFQSRRAEIRPTCADTINTLASSVPYD